MDRQRSGRLGDHQIKDEPERLTPAFERRLSKPSLPCVYLAFGAGLALGGWWLQRR